MAAANGRTEVAKLLLSKGADINVRTDEGDTPLHDAASRGHAGMVELLLSRKADVNARRAKVAGSPRQAEAGGTPLHDAVQRGREEVVGPLIDGGANVNSRSDSGRTPLHLASVKGRAGIVRRLLDAGADVNAFSDDGLTPLHAIVIGGDVGSAALLLDRGADVNVRSKPPSVAPIITARGPGSPRPSENTPLHVVVLADRPDMIELLLSREADVNARNSLGQTPLRLAKSKAVTKLLHEAGGRNDSWSGCLVAQWGADAPHSTRVRVGYLGR
jgi:ankyrin repeat protein